MTLDQTEANRWPLLGTEEEQAVLQILRDGDISTHPVIRQLEQDYRDFSGMPHALAHCNGTAALMAAFWAIGLQPGDEVLVPSATFWASVLPLVWLGAVPVFCESEPERLGLDPADLEKKITPRTRAIVVVHLWGMPSKMTEIQALARRHGLKIVEDASHAQGASWNGQPCGTLGDVAVFSLQGSKLAPAGEGGMLLCRRADYWERAVCFGDITRIIELPTAARRFAATSFGIKTRIAPVSAAIARVQLARLAGHNRRRNENLHYLSTGLEALGIHTFRAPPHVERVYFEFLVRPDFVAIGLPQAIFIDALRAEGCQIGAPRYPLLHQQPFFTEGAFREVMRPPAGTAVPDYAAVVLPVTEQANDAMVQLPSFPSASTALLDQYLLAFHKVTAQAGDIIRQAGRAQ
ncbi:DegT/DnrJ/EryC1/StrS family aminotransferase [Xylophilus sp. GOD-11R]|uniref:DegT/DnrJ/EryC1/StrS family aminotransferase n=1 Tax=Xylophilus sp. GOD-11R TaxID=3089814 RepID=UPI00298C30F6|nr:DegT/DnrJ/EryC1/StrS family aminotransferase [Xylophilus sp. GOD-11R]WPB58477.1 DegT/DnrJ/EryC1/StrS family aminotransferase [Xylophilus sp. GOD-11R]